MSNNSTETPGKKSEWSRKRNHRQRARQQKPRIAACGAPATQLVLPRGWFIGNFLLGCGCTACGNSGFLPTGTLAMIPFAAPLIFTGVSVLLLTQGNMVGAISVFIFGMFILSLGDHVLRPKIIGSSVELPFLWVLFGILGG